MNQPDQPDQSTLLAEYAQFEDTYSGLAKTISSLLDKFTKLPEANSLEAILKGATSIEKTLAKIAEHKSIVFLLSAVLLFASIIAMTSPASAAMQVPTGQQFLQYDPVAAPVQNDDAEAAKPIGVGTVATAGDMLSLHVSLNESSGLVDIYFGLFAPDIDPNNIYLLKSDNTIQTVAQGLVPWKPHTTPPVNEKLFGDIPISVLPIGPYTFYLLVTPAGNLDDYYLYATTVLPTCTTANVTEWGACHSNNTQTAISYSGGCRPPLTPLTQTCTHGPPTCTASSIISWPPSPVTVTAGQTTTVNVPVIDNCGEAVSSFTATDTSQSTWISGLSPSSGNLAIAVATTTAMYGTYIASITVHTSGLSDASFTIILNISGVTPIPNQSTLQGTYAPGEVKYYSGYATGVGRYPLLIKLEPAGSNSYSGGDMLVKYVGGGCSTDPTNPALPTTQDLANTWAYCTQQGSCQMSWNAATKQWFPPLSGGLYYHLSGDSIEGVVLYGDPAITGNTTNPNGYPIGCYYIMVTNTHSVSEYYNVTFFEW